MPQTLDPQVYAKVIRQQLDSLRAAGRLAEAAERGNFFVRALPGFRPLWTEYARILMALGRWVEAIDCLRQAEALPKEAAVVTLLIAHWHLEQCDGFVYSDSKYREKLDLWSTAIDDQFLLELNRVGYDLERAGIFKEAADCYNVVNRHRPQNWQAHLGAAKCLLSSGRYLEGGERIKALMEVNPHLKGIPVWRGEDLKNKILIVIADEGLGDVVQFVRYVPLVAERAARVVFKLRPSLQRLVGEMENVVVSSEGAGYHYACGLFALPHVIGFHPLTIPGKVPYVRAEPELVSYWRDRLPRDGFRIGIVWHCGPTHPGRPIPLACYAPLARLPGVKLISLQVEEGVEELEHMPDGMSVTTLGPELSEGPDQFVATAAAMQNLDLIITIDTSVAHVAGAMGLPVWLLLQAVPDWRWMRHPDTTPWYPTMRLFRQKVAGQWDEVVERVVDELVKLMRARAPALSD